MRPLARRGDDRAMPSVKRLLLELDADSESPVGSIRGDAVGPVRFEGWLGLAGAIDMALRTKPGDASAASHPAPTQHPGGSDER
jgi:hypothetical protein